MTLTISSTAPSTMPAMGPGAATATLGINGRQLRRLALCNLVSTTRTPGGQYRFAAADVLRLASWPALEQPLHGGIAFHVGALAADGHPVQPRNYSGFEEGAVLSGKISSTQEQDAWRGFWGCDSSYTLGVVSVSGFLVRAAALVGIDGARGGYKRFVLGPLAPEVETGIVGHRIAVSRGPVFTPLGRP